MEWHSLGFRLTPWALLAGLAKGWNKSKGKSKGKVFVSRTELQREINYFVGDLERAAAARAGTGKVIGKGNRQGSKGDTRPFKRSRTEPDSEPSPQNSSEYSSE